MVRTIVQPVWVGIALVSLALTPLAACGDDDDDTTDTGADTGAATDTAADTGPGTSTDTNAAVAPDTTGPTATTGASEPDESGDDADGADGNIDAPSNDTQDGGDTVTTDGAAEADDTGATEPPRPGVKWSDVVDTAFGATDRLGLDMKLDSERGDFTRGVLVIDASGQSSVLAFWFWGDESTTYDAAITIANLSIAFREELLSGGAFDVDGAGSIRFGSPFDQVCGVVDCDAPPEDANYGRIDGSYTGGASAKYGTCDRVNASIDFTRVNRTFRDYLKGSVAVPVVDLNDLLAAYSATGD